MKYTWDILIDTYFYMKVSAYVEEFLKCLSYLERIVLLKIVRAVCHGFDRTIHLDPPANAQAAGGAFKKIYGIIWELGGAGCDTTKNLNNTNSESFFHGFWFAKNLNVNKLVKLKSRV